MIFLVNIETYIMKMSRKKMFMKNKKKIFFILIFFNLDWFKLIKSLKKYKLFIKLFSGREF